jgi:methylmalonyl-CoA mutase
MANAVAQGWPKAMIEEASAGRQARVDRGEDVIVGVNKYRLADEDDIDILDVDNHAVRESQIARINRVKAGRDEAKCQAALDALREGAKGSANLLALAVDCARQRATLGEISSAMEDVFGRYGTKSPRPSAGSVASPACSSPRWGRTGMIAAPIWSARCSATSVSKSCRAPCSRPPRKPRCSRSTAMSTWSARRAWRRGTRP